MTFHEPSGDEVAVSAMLSMMKTGSVINACVRRFTAANCARLSAKSSRTSVPFLGKTKKKRASASASRLTMRCT